MEHVLLKIGKKIPLEIGLVRNKFSEIVYPEPPQNIFLYLDSRSYVRIIVKLINWAKRNGEKGRGGVVESGIEIKVGELKSVWMVFS